jgi:hypothetical protein
MQPNILELEFHYIKETADQAIADRYTMLNFYIGICTAVGSVCVAIITSNQSEIARLGLAGLCVLTSVVGGIFLAIMIRLRQAWHESIKALNKLKQYVISQSQIPALSQAFLWNTTTIPTRNKLWTIHFYSSLLVIMLSSVYLGVGVWLLTQIFWGGVLFTLSILILQLSLYFWLLQD